MKKELIVKSNDILAHPIYRTTIELKIFSKIILELRNNPEEDCFYLNKKDLLSSLGCDKNSYGELKKICERMFRPIDINKGKGNFILRAVFLEINADLESEILFEISPKMKPYFLNLTKNFTQYFFENIARLNSSFSIRLYELLKQYSNIGKKKISIKDLRYFLNIDDDKYIKYNHFKTRVILSGKKEIKEKTDIYFEFEEIKTGRRITAIEFFIFKNKVEKEVKKTKNTVLEEDKASEPIRPKELDLLLKYGINEKQALKLCDSHTVERIKTNIKYIKDENAKGRNKDNVAGFLVSAIENDYYNQTQLALDDKQLKKEAEKREKVRLKEIEVKKEEKKLSLEKEVKRERIEQFLAILDESDLQELNTDFIDNRLKGTFMMKHIKGGKLDLSKSSIKFNYYDFIYNNYMKDLQNGDKTV